MALQVCNRCRKRRIRCDLQLPACKNCQVADVECLFWDDSLGQNIPCSYLHSLRQKVESLKLEIKHATDKVHASQTDPRGTAESALLPEQDYHLSIFDSGELFTPSRTAYLGPGSSARILESLLKNSVHWHFANNVKVPKRLLHDAPPVLVGAQDFPASQSFPTTYDQRKQELHSLIPPSTQRAIVEHYLATVSSEYPLLSAERESALLAYENPLKWSRLNRNDPGALDIIIVFAISTALITRDLDSNLSSISMHCREAIHKISQRTESSEDSIEIARCECTVLCALSLCEVINPSSGQLWELLGRAASIMEDLRECYQLSSINLDEPFRRLEQCLLKLESVATLQFHCPSQFLQMRLQDNLEDHATPSSLSSELRLLSNLHSIFHWFTESPRPSEAYFESLIPLPMQVDTIDSDISISSARLYIALHPLFTTLDVYCSTTPNDPGSRLFHIIANSASIMIDQYTQLNKDNKILSIWLATERILECGAIWAAYLINQSCITPRREFPLSGMGTRTVMSPVLKVSVLLASLTARWKGGLAYVEAWEAVVELLWNML